MADPVTRALVRQFIDKGTEGRPPEMRRAAYGLLEGWVSVVVNTLLFGVKLALGIVTGSLALMADAAHTLADSLTSIVVIVSSKAAAKPPDAEHPYGHGRVESIATITVAVLLAVAGFEFGKASVERILAPEEVTASWAAIGIVLGTAAVKEWLSHFAAVLGKASGNAALEADAWHHRSDVFATLLVVVAMVAGRYGLSAVDGWIGLAVALVIAKVALDIARGAIDTLIGPAPTAEEVATIKDRALGVDGVRSVHDIVVHTYGQTRFISLHVETTAAADPETLHGVAELVEDRVGDGRHGSVCVHIDPVNEDHPAYERLRRAVGDAVSAEPRAVSFHDLRLVGPPERFTVLFDLNVEPGCTAEESAKIRANLASVVGEVDGAADVVIEVEPDYTYQP